MVQHSDLSGSCDGGLCDFGFSPEKPHADDFNRTVFWEQMKGKDAAVPVSVDGVNPLPEDPFR